MAHNVLGNPSRLTTHEWSDGEAVIVCYALVCTSDYIPIFLFNTLLIHYIFCIITLAKHFLPFIYG